MSVRPLETVADVTVAVVVAVALANPQQIRQHQLSSATTAVTAMAQKDKSGKSRFRASPREAQGTERVRLFFVLFNVRQDVRFVSWKKFGSDPISSGLSK